MKLGLRVLAVALAAWGLFTLLSGREERARQDLDSASEAVVSPDELQNRNEDPPSIVVPSSSRAGADSAKALDATAGATGAGTAGASAERSADEIADEPENAEAENAEPDADDRRPLTGTVAERLGFIHGQSVTSYSGLGDLARDRLKKSALGKRPTAFVTAPIRIRRHWVRFGFVIDVEKRIYANRVCLRDERGGAADFGYRGVPHHFGIVGDRLRAWLPRTNPAVEDLRFNRFVLEFPTQALTRRGRGRAQLYQLKRESETEAWKWEAARTTRFWTLGDEASERGSDFACNWTGLEQVIP